MGRVGEAIAELEKALESMPDYAERHANLGPRWRNRAGRPALPHMRKAVQYSPKDANAHRNLALALLLMGKPAEALPDAEQAVKLSGGKDPSMLNLLGRVYGEMGRLPEALRALRQALALATARNNRELVQELNDAIAVLSSSQPAPLRR